jgi:(p)ppGpp synthase/HD superfamily hydrolase
LLLSNGDYHENQHWQSKNLYSSIHTVTTMCVLTSFSVQPTTLTAPLMFLT